MIKAVLFDIDGVLLDSFEVTADWFRRILKAHGYKKPTGAEIRSAFGMHLHKALLYLTKEKSAQKLKDMVESADNFRYAANKIKFDKNCASTIRLLARHYKIGIVTSRRRSSAQDAFMIKGIKRYVRTVVALEDAPEPKPSPLPLLVAARRLRVRPSECVYVGDADTDIIAAHAAGMKSIHFSRKRHRHADASVISFSAIAGAVGKMK